MPILLNMNGLEEILINGRFYDITDFTHPGGSIINFFSNSGADASLSFNEFHHKSSRAQLYLRSLKSRKASSDELLHAKNLSQLHNDNTPSDHHPLATVTRVDALDDDFVSLRNQLVNEGFFNPSIPHVCYRSYELIVLFVLSFILVLQNSCMPIVILGIFLNGIAQGRCGWLMHEAGHYSLTGDIRIDKRIQEFVYGFGCGMSASWWRVQHNKHHVSPQKLKHDVDLNTLPLLAFNKAAITNKTRNNLWIKYQAYLFFPITSFFVGLGWTLFLHPRHSLRKMAVFEMCSILLRYGTLCTIYLTKYTIVETLFIYCFTFIIACNYIFINFAVSHTHLPVSQSNEYLHWVVYSAMYTTNITPNRFCNWWMAYLNFQIEHHLFPSMPQFRHPLVSHRIKHLFEKHGFVYDVRSYWTAMYDTFNNLNNISKLIKSA